MDMEALMKAAPVLAIGAAAALAYYALSATMPAAAMGTAEELDAASAQVATSGDLVLSDYQGKPVVLNFWAPWCPPCRAEIPAFAAFAEANPDVAVLGIGVDAGPPDKLPRAAARFGITYPVYPSTDALARTYGVSALPTTVVLDAKGEVVRVHTGMMSAEQLKSAVDAAR